MINKIRLTDIKKYIEYFKNSQYNSIYNKYINENKNNGYYLLCNEIMLMEDDLITINILNKIKELYKIKELNKDTNNIELMFIELMFIEKILHFNKNIWCKNEACLTSLECFSNIDEYYNHVKKMHTD